MQCTVNGVDYQPTIASDNKKKAKLNAALVALQDLGLMPKDPNNPLWIDLLCSKLIQCYHNFKVNQINCEKNMKRQRNFDEKMAANGIVFFCFLLQRIKITEFPSVLRHLLFEEQFRIWGAYGLHYRFNIMIFVIE